MEPERNQNKYYNEGNHSKRPLHNKPQQPSKNGKYGKDTKRTFKGSASARKRCEKNIRQKFASIVLAASLALNGIGAVSRLADDINKQNVLKQSIISAQVMDEYLSEINTVELNGQYRSAYYESIKDNMAQQISEFNENVQRYAELQDKQRTAEEEQEMISLAQTIYNSYMNIVDFRTALLKTEVAKAEGIYDPAQIAKIEITCIWHDSSEKGYDPTPSIKLPNGKSIEMDAKLEQEVKDIKHPLLEKKTGQIKPSSEMTVEELEKGAQKVIEYYNDIDYEHGNEVVKKDKLFGGTKYTTQKDKTADKIEASQQEADEERG